MSNNEVLELTDEQKAELAKLDEQLEKFEAAKRWSDVIRTTLAKAEIVNDPIDKSELFRSAGNLYLERASNQAEAIKCFERVLELVPGDAEAIEKLKEGYTKRLNWEGLVRLMDREAETLDGVARFDALVAAADLATAKLRKPEICIELWEKVREADPYHPQALEQLSSWYDRSREFRKLADVLEVLVEGNPDPKMLQKLGALYAEKLEDDEGAVRAFRRLLLIDPEDRRAQEQLKKRYAALKQWDDLEEFYATSDKWDELIRTYERAAEEADASTDDKVDLLFRAARLWVDKKDQPPRAARAYEKVLEIDSTNLRAAEALSPIYSAAGDARKLAPVLEVRLGHDMEPEARVALLHELADMYEHKLRQPEIALERYLSAFSTMPTDERARESSERLSAQLGSWDKLTATYESSIDNALGDEAIALRLGYGGVLRKVGAGKDDASYTDRAIAQYRAVYEASPDHTEAIAALGELYTETKRFPELLEVLDMRLELESDGERRRSLSYRRAVLIETQLADADRAIEAYDSILMEYGPEEIDAYRALDRLYESEGRYEDLARVLENRIDLGPDSVEELAALKFRLGRVQAQHLGGVETGVELYREVLTLMPEHEGARGALEALLEHETVAPSAAAILEAVYESQGRSAELIRALQVLCKATDDPDAKVELLSKIARVHAELGQADDAFAAYADALRASPEHPQTLQTLELLVIEEERQGQLSQLLRELAATPISPDLARTFRLKSARIEDEELGNVDAAVSTYRAMLDEDPSDEDALASLEALFGRTQRFTDLVDVLRRKSEQTVDPDAKEAILIQMARIFDSNLSDADRAAEVYSEVLSLNPTSEAALREMDQLFERQEKWSDLADNLGRRLELAQDDEQQIDLMLRLALLREHKMNSVSSAIEIYRDVILRDATNAQAIANLERLLAAGVEPLQIAEVLEPVYQDTGEIEKLIGVHEVQARLASSPERRVDLLHRIADLHEVALDNYAAAFETYARALAEDPGNAETQSHLDRLGPVLGDFSRLAQVYEERVATTVENDPALSAHLYTKIAKIREERLGDAEGAIRNFSRVIELDDQNFDAAASLERLYYSTERFAELADISLRQAEMVSEPDRQKLYIYRAAQIHEEVLENRERAIEIYERVLAVDPEDMHSLDKMIELNLALEKWDDLLSVYNRKADVVIDPEEKKRIYAEVGAVWEQELKDSSKAIDTYERILELDPEDPTALARLDHLYQAAGRWRELLSVLEREAEIYQEPAEVLSFRHRIGALHQIHLQDGPRAVEIFRDILETAPDYAPSIEALEGMISSGDHALEAADVLEPIFTNFGESAKLVRVLEVQFENERDSVRRVELLHRVAELREFHLDDPDFAFDAFARALPLDNRHEPTLVGLERLAEQGGRYPDVCRLYDAEFEKLSASSPSDAVDFGMRLAGIFESKLGNIDAAIARYERVVALDSANVDAIVALDRLFEKTERWTDLARVLEQEIQVAGDPDEVMRLNYRLARLHQDHLGQVALAIGRYEEILTAAPDHLQSLGALEQLFAQGIEPLRVGEVLTPLYEMQGAWAQLIAVHEVQLAQEGDALRRVEMMHRIASIAEEQAGDENVAFFWMQRAVLENPSHEDSVEHAERLSAMSQGWVQLADTFAVSIASTRNTEARVGVASRLARIYENELGDVARAEETYRYLLGVDGANQTALEALDRIYGDYQAFDSLAEVLKRRVQQPGDADAIDLNYRLGEVLERDLGRTNEAIGVYTRLLSDLEPAHPESIKALQDIYTRQKNWNALLGAFEQELGVVSDESHRADVYAKMARLAADHLGQVERGIDLWREVLDIRGEDPEALNALGTIYANREDWGSLVEILDREAMVVTDDRARVMIYADMARIWYEKLGRATNAVAAWERILDIHPGSTDALVHIAEIHRASGSTHELVETLHRLADVGQQTLGRSELEHVYMQLGHLYATELDQSPDAVEAYENAVRVNPSSFAALDALELIHRREEDWPRAIRVMERRAKALVAPEQKIEQYLAVAKIYSDRIGQADGGTAAFLSILEIDPLHAYAFERAEALHKEAGRHEDLIELYSSRVEAEEDERSAVRLLRKVAKVAEEKLGDEEQAFDALQIAWSFQYDDEKTVRELTRVTRATNRWNDLLTAANAAIAETTDQRTKIILCIQCANWYGQELDRADYAIRYYDEVQSMDPGNVRLMVSRSELYAKTQQWDALAQTYGQIVATSDDPKISADTYTKMGELAATHLNMPAQSLGYYEKAVEVFPTHVGALSALERLYSAAGDTKKLIFVLQNKVRGLEEPDEVLDAQLKLAEVYENQAGDLERAVETYSDVRARHPHNLAALRGLERLYRRLERWQDLLEVLGAELEEASAERERVDLLEQIAQMWSERFLKPEKAAEEYERLLDIDPGHEGALRELARIYRASQRWDDVIRTYERHVGATLDRNERLRVLRAMGETYDMDLKDSDRAIDTYLEVLSTSPDDAEALDALARLYEKRGEAASALEMMERLAARVSDPARKVDLYFRSGRVLDEELGDRMAALDRFQLALDVDSRHLGALAAMRSIHMGSGDWHSAAKLLEREAEAQPAPRLVAATLVELGNLYEGKLHEHDRAVASWRSALEKEPDNEGAAAPLAAEYRNRGDFEAAFPLQDMLVKRSGKREPYEQHQLALELGDTSMRLERFDDGVRAFEKAAQLDPTHLPSLLGLAGAYFGAKQWEKAFKQYQGLLLQHREELDATEQADLYYHQGVIKREQGEKRKALNLLDKALELDPSHRPTLEAVVGLYESGNEWAQVVHFKKQILDGEFDTDPRFELLDQMGSIWMEKLNNPHKAIELWGEASAMKPNDHRMLHKLLEVYQKTAQWERAIEIIDRVASLDGRPSAQAKYAYTVAVILRDELKDADAALGRFEGALELDAGSLKAFEAIVKILTNRRDWKSLERAYRKMLKRTFDSNGSVALKCQLFDQLGIIYRDRLQDFEKAAEAFKSAAGLQPEEPRYHKMLSEIFAMRPETHHLAIAEHQWMLAQDPYKVDSYAALFHLYFDARAYDKAWCLASALTFLNKATDEQKSFYQQYAPRGPVRPRAKVERNLWYTELTHPKQDRYVTKIMEIMAPAALAVKQSSDRALKIDKLKPEDVASSTVQLVRAWGFSLQMLGIPMQPRLFLQTQGPGGLGHLPGSNPPAAICGSTLLSGYTPEEFSFVTGRFLTYYLTEHFVRTLFSSHTELGMLLRAALRITGTGPADAQADAWAQQLAPHMNAVQTDALRQVCRRLVEDRGNADVKAWMQYVELTAIRAGFLVCNSLEVAKNMIQRLPPEGAVDLPPTEKLKDLVLFSVSENYFRLREALGIQIQI